MGDRKQFISTLNKRELAEAVADHLMVEMEQEADNVGTELSDYDVDSYFDALDSFSMNVQQVISSRIKDL